MPSQLSLNPEQPGSFDREIIQHGGDFGGGFNERDSERDIPIQQHTNLLPDLQLPRTSAPPVNINGIHGSLGGSASVQQSQSSSTPGLLSPDSGQTAGNFEQLQGGIGLNQLQGDAINRQQQLGGTLRGLLGQAGQGARDRINAKFDVAANNVKGSLVSRGFAGSSLNLPGQVAVESGRQGELGSLEAQLLGARSDSESENAKSVSDLLFGSSKQATNLLGGILGSSGVGNFAESTTSASSATNSKPSNLGGGTGGGSTSKSGPGSQNRLGELPRLGDLPQQKSGSSGGGSSAGATSGGAPSNLPNPFFDPAQGGGPGPGGDKEDFNKLWGDDEQSNDGTPLEEQDLEPDSGPIQTPEAFKRNAARLNAKNAANAAGSAQGTPLAQSAAGTSGMIDAGASLA